MKNNLTVFQTGDFIWEYLLGQSFTESRPYDSFDITDFDTVDRHAITDVFEFLQKDDWNIIFGKQIIHSQVDIYNSLCSSSCRY